MKRLLLLGTSLILLFSCQRAIIGASHFKPGTLPSQQITIYTAHDTIVHLPSGTMINIPAHSSEGDTVSLTIKEALHITDMIHAGLSTRSDGIMLEGSYKSVVLLL